MALLNPWPPVIAQPVTLQATLPARDSRRTDDLTTSCSDRFCSASRMASLTSLMNLSTTSFSNLDNEFVNWPIATSSWTPASIKQPLISPEQFRPTEGILRTHTVINLSIETLHTTGHTNTHQAQSDYMEHHISSRLTEMRRKKSV